MRKCHSRRASRPILTLIAAHLALVASLVPGRAAAVDPAWSIDFEGAIVWQQVTTLGDLIVATTDGLHAVDAQSGLPTAH